MKIPPLNIEKHPGQAARRLKHYWIEADRYSELVCRLREQDPPDQELALAAISAANSYANLRDELKAQFRAVSRCTQCGKLLEDPDSIARQVGPDCWRKLRKGVTK